jgi:hypothetical protein
MDPDGVAAGPRPEERHLENPSLRLLAKVYRYFRPVVKIFRIFGASGERSSTKANSEI